MRVKIWDSVRGWVQRSGLTRHKLRATVSTYRAPEFTTTFTRIHHIQSVPGQRYLRPSGRSRHPLAQYQRAHVRHLPC
jgi:hypothetical protein